MSATFHIGLDLVALSLGGIEIRCCGISGGSLKGIEAVLGGAH